MADYGALQPPTPKGSKGLVASSDARALAMRDAEQTAAEMAKLAAAEAFSEVRELIGDVKALRLAGRLRDSGKTAKELATTGAILTDKALLLEGRPNVITERRDADDIWRSIFRQAGLTDSTAEEIPDADVVEEPKKGTKKRGTPKSPPELLP